jgi:hypothetical protein
MRRSVLQLVARLWFVRDEGRSFQERVRVRASDDGQKTNGGTEEIRAKLQNCVDTLFIVPQYLVI